MNTISNTADFIKESRDGLVREGLLGAFFAVLTIFLFLLSVRSHARGGGEHPAVDPHRADGHGRLRA